MIKTIDSINKVLANKPEEYEISIFFTQQGDWELDSSDDPDFLVADLLPGAEYKSVKLIVSRFDEEKPAVSRFIIALQTVLLSAGFEQYCWSEGPDADGMKEYSWGIEVGAIKLTEEQTEKLEEIIKERNGQSGYDDDYVYTVPGECWTEVNILDVEHKHDLDELREIFAAVGVKIDDLGDRVNHGTGDWHGRDVRLYSVYFIVR